ncbi:MAG TPA: Ig-like domain-containing protein, partial [Methylomirabilota bacterium]|nr:Ig-like domain-containing protein [Methylomirabilota bacterium]
MRQSRCLLAGVLLFALAPVRGSSAPPPNDAFADRLPLAGAVVSTSGSNVDATLEGGEPAHWPATPGGKSVWWTWTAPNSGPATITTAGSDFDTLLAVYTGASLGSLSLVANNDDTNGTSRSGVQFTAAAGTVYQIAVDGFGSGANAASGNIQLNITNLAQTAVTLVAPNAVWKYLDNGSDQGTAWRELGFNDTTWLTGAAQLGYGDGDETTVVGFGPDSNNKYITTYFRRSFMVGNPGAFSSLTIRLMRDDGAVVYLNGVEVMRDNLPVGPIAFNTLALTAIGGAAESQFISTTIGANLLAANNVLAVEMHQNATASSDISFALELIGNVGGSNQPPTTAITSPSSGAGFSAPASITINATASDNDGAVTLVEFFQGDTKLGEDNSNPYSFTWNNVIAGNYALRTVATDNGGLKATSGVVNVTVTGNAPPTASLTSPAEGARFTPPVTINLVATAADIDGTIAKVEFYQGTTKLGEDTTSPFSFDWVNPAVGTYALRAVATDNAAARGTSGVVNVIVAANTAPTVALTSPSEGASFGAPATVPLAASVTDLEGPVARVEFFANDAKIAEDTTAPFSFDWPDVGAGGYALRAVATDAGGLSATSSVVNITVTETGSFTNVLISGGSVWRYLDNGSDQGTAWSQPGFNDAAWASGPAQLGYGDGDEATVVNGGTPGNRFITTYFRHTFNVANAASYTNLDLTILFDDGAVAYLNGVEIYRTPNMPGGVISFNTASGQGQENQVRSANVNAALPLLVNGANVLAVEVHQDAPTSSDISFDFALVGITGVPPSNAPPTVAITAPSNNTSYNFPASIAIAADASDPDGSVSRVEFYANGARIGEDTTGPFSLVWPGIGTGNYVLRAVAVDNGGRRATS